MPHFKKEEKPKKPVKVEELKEPEKVEMKEKEVPKPKYAGGGILAQPKKPKVPFLGQRVAEDYLKRKGKI